MSTNNTSITTIGSASQDVFLMGKALTARRDVRSRDYVEQFPLGAKIDVEEMVFDTGGGASNAAVTFARQGFKVAYVGKVGHDPAGSEVLRVMRREGISTEHVAYDTRLSTQYSTFLLSPSGERTILVYRGASVGLQAKDIAIRNLSSQWFYISTLAGNFNVLTKLIKHANNHGISVALNPGSAELAQPRKLRALLPLINTLIANLEEMQMLFGLKDEVEILRRASHLCPYVLLTDGPRGSLSTDGLNMYRAGQYQKVKVIDRTGAGDAFGSGFVAGIAGGLAMEDAITLASANSTSVVQKIGAKPGILRATKLKRIKMKITRLHS